MASHGGRELVLQISLSREIGVQTGKNLKRILEGQTAAVLTQCLGQEMSSVSANTWKQTERISKQMGLMRLRKVKRGKGKAYFEVTIPIKAIETLRWNDGDVLVATVDREKDQLKYKRAKLG